MKTLNFKINIQTSEQMAAVIQPLNDIDRNADAAGG